MWNLRLVDTAHMVKSLQPFLKWGQRVGVHFHACCKIACALPVLQQQKHLRHPLWTAQAKTSSGGT
jgi:hypothetical protein